MKRMVLSGIVILVAAAVFFAAERGADRLCGSADDAASVGEPPSETDGPRSPLTSGEESVPDGEEVTDAAEGGDESETEAEEPEKTPEELAEEAEERAVEEFDALTDVWMEQTDKEVSMADIDRFGTAFRKVPEARRDECVHRALNLIPDENVMLLVGILMDKSMDREIVETVFNDVLNRDEEVKKPVLQQIFKDKSHPCWADVAWILDVTDELPEK